ncbi:hypothetical protein XP95_23460 [Xanthomonas perforans]|nr:hypothetical protein XP95_23460 [Xanthomonas perforans]
MACQINRTNNAISAGHGVEGYGSVIEVAVSGAARLFAADLPAYMSVFAASGSGEPAGDG